MSTGEPGPPRFRVLGEVEVLLDDRPVDVGHARQRRVLAALLLDVNRPVPTDELIDRVWADRPPHRARNALQAYVSRLRQMLSFAPGTRIGRRGGGYVLDGDAATVDVHEFRALVGRARSAGTGDAAALFGRALELWRGEPLATMDTPWFDAVRTSLAAERYAAELDRNDAALRAGRHADVLVDLADAVRDQPLDERLAGQLMLAQYRSGRQADAMETYRAVRERLADELGVDPGVALRGVHRQILTGDAAAPTGPVRPEPVRAEPVRVTPVVVEAPVVEPEVVVEPEPVVPERAAAPAALPRRVTSFVGRADDVALVGAALRAGPLVTLTGVGGVGKSRLAAEVAAGVEGYPDGRTWCELAPLEDGGPVARAVAAALRLQQRQGSTIEQTVIEYLRDRELLLVVDNCEHVLAQAAGLLDEVVRRCPRVTVLATSREPLGVEGEQVLPVDPLPARDAAALFAERARAVRPGFDPDGETAGAVVDVCRRLDGLPLGIELAAARMRVMNAAEVASRLVGPRFVSGGSRVAPARHQSLAATVDWSYRLLSERERSLFRRLSVLAGRFDVDAAHGACGAPGDSEDDTLELLAGLVDKSMVTVDHTAEQTGYRLLETMRQYGRERLAEADELDAARQRHAVHVLDLIERGGPGLLGPDEAVWVERLLAAYDDLRIAVGWATTRGDADLALRLVAWLPDLAFWRIGYEMVEWSEAALRLPGADAHPLAPAVYGGAARGCWCLGDFDRAIRLARATGMPEWIEGPSRSIQPAEILAVIDLYEGRGDAALAAFTRQVEVARASGDAGRVAWTLSQLSLCHAFRGEPRLARLAGEESLALAREGGNPSAVAMGMMCVGRGLQAEDPAAALRYLDASVELFASVGSRWFVAFAGMYAVATHVAISDLATATGVLVPVLDEWEQIGDRSQQWLCLLFATQLLIRVDARAEAVTLHHALVAAAQPAPFDADRLASLAESLGAGPFEAAARRGSEMDGSAAVAFVRARLRADGTDA